MAPVIPAPLRVVVPGVEDRPQPEGMKIDLQPVSPDAEGRAIAVGRGTYYVKK